MLEAVSLSRTVEGIPLQLGRLQVFPGMVNSHDHLEFALFPRLGHGPYANASAWARDIYHPDRSPIREHLLVPKPLRLLWGGLRNLASGVTTVAHHNPYDPVFDTGFPLRVVKHYGWAHSLSFAEDIGASVAATPPGAPFVIHLGEGTDAESRQEIFRLRDMGALTDRTVLVHCVALDAEGWSVVAESGASVIWCPRSNLFTLGRTIDLDQVPDGVPLVLGTDSPLSAEGDLIDEIRAARLAGAHPDAVRDMVTGRGKAVMNLGEQPEDWIGAPHFGAPPALVVVAGRIHLIDPALAPQLPPSLREEFYPLSLEGRSTVLVRWNVPRLIEQTRPFLPHPVRLAGREVMA